MLLLASYFPKSDKSFPAAPKFPEKIHRVTTLFSGSAFSFLTSWLFKSKINHEAITLTSVTGEADTKSYTHSQTAEISHAKDVNGNESGKNEPDFAKSLTSKPKWLKSTTVITWELILSSDCRMLRWGVRTKPSWETPASQPCCGMEPCHWSSSSQQEQVEQSSCSFSTNPRAAGPGGLSFTFPQEAVEEEAPH